MIKLLCFAAFCLAGSQAGWYADVQQNSDFLNQAEVYHGAQEVHDLVEDVPEFEAKHDDHVKNDDKYDDQFDEIAEDHSNGHNFYNPKAYSPNVLLGKSYGHGVDTYGRTFDVKSDFYNDQSNVFDQKYVPAMHVPKVYQAERVHGYAAPAVSHAAYPPVYYSHGSYAPVVDAHRQSYNHGVETYGRTFDVKSDFYNDQSNVFDQKHVPSMHVPKVYQAERVHSYVAPAVVDTYGSSKVYEHDVSREGYAAPVKGYAHGDDYKFSGRNTPTTAGNYVGYGNKYDFRHGYPYGYGEMLENTPAGYSLHSGSNKLMTKQPKYEFNHAKYDYNQANTHGPVIDSHSSKGYGHEAYADVKGYSNEVYGSRQGYGAPVKGYGHQAYVNTNEVYDNSKGYAHGDDYKFSGHSTPTTAGHYVGYGNKYDFRHGYPYGYGEMLDNTPAGYSLHSGSTRLMTKQPKYDYNQGNTHGLVINSHSSKGYGHEAYADSKDYSNEVYNSRQGYGAPAKGYGHQAYVNSNEVYDHSKGYAHGDEYKFSGRSTPTTAGHYVGYGNKYDFRHGYPYGYGEMLDNTPAGFSLHSGSKYSHISHPRTAVPSKNSHNYRYTKY